MRQSMVLCCICGKCGCGRSGAYLGPELQPSPNNPGGCDVHCYAPCCMSFDCLGYRHCTLFFCCTPSKDQMLRMDKPWYHDARVAIAKGDLSAVPPGLAHHSLSQSYREAGPYGKELWHSRKDLLDLCCGGDRFPGGPSLCCGDFWFHPPPFICCLPLLRFPVENFEYVADTGEASLLDLASAALAAMSPQDRAAALAAMSPEDRAAALAAMSPEDQAAALAAMSAEEQAATLAAMSPEEQAAALAAMSGSVNAGTPLATECLSAQIRCVQRLSSTLSGHLIRNNSR